MCGNVSDLGCLVFQNPCQGLAGPERQRLAPFPATLRPLWQTPSNACSRRDLDSLAGTSKAHCNFFSFLCFLISSLAQSLSQRNAPNTSAKMCLPFFQVARAQLSVDRWAHHLGNSQFPGPDGVSLVQEKAHNWVAGTDALQTVSGSVLFFLRVPHCICTNEWSSVTVQTIFKLKISLLI